MSSYQQIRPGRRLPPVILHLIIINVLVTLAINFLPQYDLVNKLAVFFPTDPRFEVWQIITHMFSHQGQFHLLFNMFGLWMFGTPLANRWGKNRFLVFYIFSGLGAYILYTIMEYVSLQQGGFPHAALGASGAVYGILTGYAFLFPNNVIQLIFPPIPLKAKYFVPILIAIDLFAGFSKTSTGIAHFAHIGGALTGFIILLIWQKNKKRLY